MSTDVNFYSKEQTDTKLGTKQDTLVSGTNIKTVNSTSLVGSGNVQVQATLESGVNIKTINGNTLLGSGDITITATGGVSAHTYSTVGELGADMIAHKKGILKAAVTLDTNINYEFTFQSWQVSSTNIQVKSTVMQINQSGSSFDIWATDYFDISASASATTIQIVVKESVITSGVQNATQYTVNVPIANFVYYY